MDDYLSSEELRAQRRAIKAAKARSAQDDSVVQSIMGAPAGRAWIHAKLESYAILHESCDPNPYITYFQKGQRSVGLELLADIMRACPDAYIQMMREANGERRDDSHDRSDHDDERNYDSAGRWIGSGDGPEE